MLVQFAWEIEESGTALQWHYGLNTISDEVQQKGLYEWHTERVLRSEDVVVGDIIVVNSPCVGLVVLLLR